MRIPSQEKKIIVSHKSDLMGNISYTKNINLDEQGYVKLSQRTVQLQSEKIDANMELPLALGRTFGASTIDFVMVSSEDAFNISISNSAITVTEDTSTGNPVYTLDSHGKFFHNLWVVTDDNDFFSKDLSTGDYTDGGNLTTGVAHPIEVFRNKNLICFGNGNTVVAYSESGGSFTLVSTLTLPVDYEVIGLAYSNYTMGVITQLSSVIEGQNQDAFFFAWDGATTEAKQGIGIGSDRALGIYPYKGSFVVLTRAGQLRYFTGGGWQELAQLPFYFRDVTFGTSYNRDMYGDIMQVEGDIIYINYNGLVASHGEKYQQYLENNPGGVMVYDPEVGLYHRYSHSVSPVSMLTVTGANVNTSTDIMTKTAGTIPSTGSPIKYTSDKSQQIGGLKTPKIYYCIKHTSSTFSLAETKELALSGVKIDLTSTGATNNYFLALEVYDYGTTLANNVGAMAMIGTDNGICNSLIFGSQLSDFDSASRYNSLNLVVSGFDNRGYFVTSKGTTDNVSDTNQEVLVKYKPLKETDKIILKYKGKELVGLPVSTPQARTSGVNQCSWLGTDLFTTTADLEDAKTAIDAGVELECEVIAGAGAGTMTKISTITYESGTYSVQLAEDVDGASSGRYCDIIIDNWTVVGQITSDDTDGYKEIPIGESSKFYKLKVELRGSDVTIEDIQPVKAQNQSTS